MTKNSDVARLIAKKFNFTLGTAFKKLSQLKHGYEQTQRKKFKYEHKPQLIENVHYVRIQGHDHFTDEGISRVIQIIKRA